ncbi:3-phosphoshikimate 1-carboxyvinyltransferase [Micromonospora avicenniae]|uniref:3-phosphoshikimate 1-carboxyvinyltransferase n=1 Tax=Micromonospora avicenniae TaxID=1198245 RepID=A0A1N7CL76_9ACTN|nr:3-phosphoshikimate 1-carboxyvinyltransferase [Micromonospora avicenniae]SIR64320.1 3-phosphoshikimate 1-carboxyvinyltransferase [Micromonospora avicenniae]
MGNLTATRPPQPWTAPTASDPVAAMLRLPGSKSMTARALVLSALAGGPSTLAGPLRARDTELMAAGLRGMGAHVSISDDERWLVRPHRLVGPAHVDVGLAGTVMRFAPPVAGLADGRITFDGDPHARTRPLGPLIGALRSLGVRIDVEGPGSLPLTVLGAGRVAGGEVVIDASASSQLVSGLLLAAPRFDRGVVVRHVGPPVPSAPHLRMTVQMLRAAGAAVDDTVADVWVVEPGPIAGRGWQIEPDLSGAVPFFAAALVTGGEVTLQGWPHSSAQPVERLRELLQRMGGEVTLTTDGLTVRGTGSVHGLEADLSDVSELTPALTALAMLADSPSRFTGVAHIRGHETDRIAALAREFTALGADLTESHDGLQIRPRPLRGGTFRTYADHRMAHAAAVAGLAVPGIEVDDVACTSKTMPEFPALWSAMVTGKS